MIPVYIASGIEPRSQPIAPGEPLGSLCFAVKASNMFLLAAWMCSDDGPNDSRL
jgi:hypothetical protein